MENPYINVFPIPTWQSFFFPVTNARDSEGHIVSAVDSKGGTLSSTYNSSELLASRSLSATGLPPVRIDLGYSSRDDLTSINRYTDLAGTQLVGTTAITVDDAHRVTNIAHKNAAGATLSNYADAFDPGDRLTSENWVSGANSGSRNFGYDSTNQLTSDGTSNWSFDLNGNRTVSGYQTGVANRLLSDGTWNYGYDDAGNMISKSRIGGNEVWTFGYDHLNHLISIIQVVNGVTQLTINYTYDIFGQRIQESKWKPSTGTVTTRFAYANGILYADLDGSSNILVRYVLGDEVDQLFARVVGSGPNAGVAFYLTDRLGSVRDLMDTTQVIRDHLDYDGFGSIALETNSGFGDRFKFNSREWDPDTRWDYHRARYEQPDVGRWNAEDPAGFGARDSNLYRYGGNQPPNGRDPTGLDFWDVASWFTDRIMILPNPIRAIKEGNAIHLVPVYKDIYDAGKGAYDDVAGYENGGMDEPSAGLFTLFFRTPGISWGLTITEIGDGISYRGADLGKPLTLGDTVSRIGSLVIEVAAASITLRPGKGVRTSKSTMSNNKPRPRPKIEPLERETLKPSAVTAPSTTANTAGRGTVTFERIPGQAQPHVTVATEFQGTALHTEQVIVPGANNPTTVMQVQRAQRIGQQVQVALPNAQAAQAYQQRVVGANGGPYNAATNSCVTHVAKVLNAGGLDLPTATRAAIVALRRLMGGG